MTKDYLKIFSTYSDVFGNKITKQEIEALIKKAPLLRLFISLSVMSFTNEEEEENIKNEYCNYLIQEGTLDRSDCNPSDFFKNRCAFSSQGNLATWKWLLAFGENLEGRETNIKVGINQAILLQSAIADYLYEESNVKDITIVYEIFKNKMFNTKDNLFSMLVRAKSIFIDFAKQENLFNPKEYVDFNTDFEMHYGYTIEDYLVVVTALVVLYLNAYVGGTIPTDLEKHSRKQNAEN